MNAEVKPSARFPRNSVVLPSAMLSNPRERVNRGPRREPKKLEPRTPSIEPVNWAVNRYPACASFSAHRLDKMGSKGPSIVFTTPVNTKPRWSETEIEVLPEFFDATCTVQLGTLSSNE
jgi:hypothetical protein